MSEKERYTEAAANLHRALAKWPNDTMSYRLLGQTQMHLLDFAAAERTYEELGYRTALTMDDQLNYAKCMMQQGKYAEAADVLEWLMVEENTPEYVQRVWDRCTSQLHVDEDDRHWQISPLRFPGSKRHPPHASATTNCTSAANPTSGARPTKPPDSTATKRGSRN